MDNNFNLYHIFYTVARCKNISAAARTLFISQPAISKSISRLEQNLNTTLFVRSSRGVSLTTEGQLLFSQVETAFQAIRHGEEQIKRAGELGIGKLSIGVSTTLCKYVLLPYLRAFTHACPHVKISISCQSSYQTIKALENGTIDIGLIGEPGKSRGLSFFSLEEIQDIFVTTPSYLDNLKKRMMNMQTGGENGLFKGNSLFSFATLILLDEDNLTRQYVDKYLDRQMIESDRLIEVTTMDLLIEFAKIDLGIACVIGNFVKDQLAEGTLIPVKSPAYIPSRKIGLACKKETALSPTAGNFLDFVLKQNNTNK